MGRRTAAHNLFARLTDDLAAVNPAYRGLVGCPLCLRLFTEDAIDLEEPELTEEHIIPRELGGKITTLSCKRCNNTHGSEIDAHLIQMIRSNDSIEGLSNRPFPGRIEVAGVTVPTDVDWKADVGQMTTFRLRRFNPVAHEAIQSHMRGGNLTTINVTFSLDFIPGRANIALLRIAYLAMFREVGYRYILSPAASVMRNIINSFQSPTDIGRFVGHVGGEPERFGKPLQFLKINGGIAVMVVMTLITETKRCYAVFMPSPELLPESVIGTLCDAAESIARRPPAETQCA